MSEPRTVVIAQDSDGNLYAKRDGAVFRSADNGKSWRWHCEQPAWSLFCSFTPLENLAGKPEGMPA